MRLSSLKRIFIAFQTKKGLLRLLQKCSIYRVAFEKDNTHENSGITLGNSQLQYFLSRVSVKYLSYRLKLVIMLNTCTC